MRVNLYKVKIQKDKSWQIIMTIIIHVTKGADSAEY